MNAILKREYRRKWRLGHKKEIAESHYKYYLGHKEKCDEYTHRWNQENRELVNQYKAKAYRKYYPKLKQEVLGHYSDGNIRCAECGKKRNLGIDHCNGGGEKHRLALGINSSYQFYLWLKRNNYPDGYRVLCRSCNSHFRLMCRGISKHPRSAMIKTVLKQGEIRARDIASLLQASDLSRHTILGGLYCLVKSGEALRTKRGYYVLAN